MKIAAKVNEYIKNGKPQFVYSLDCSKDELKEYESSITSAGYKMNLSEDKKPLYWSQRTLEIGQDLVKTASGRYQVLQNLEVLASEIQVKSAETVGKLTGIQSFFGLSKAQMEQRAFASL